MTRVTKPSATTQVATATTELYNSKKTPKTPKTALELINHVFTKATVQAILKKDLTIDALNASPKSVIVDTKVVVEPGHIFAFNYSDSQEIGIVFSLKGVKQVLYFNRWTKQLVALPPVQVKAIQTWTPILKQ